MTVRSCLRLPLVVLRVVPSMLSRLRTDLPRTRRFVRLNVMTVPEGLLKGGGMMRMAGSLHLRVRKSLSMEGVYLYPISMGK